MGFFLTVSCTPVLWGRGQEPAEGVLPVHQLPAAEKPRPPLAWPRPHPRAVTTFNSASPQRISGSLVFSGFICLRALRPPSHAFLFTLFLSKTLESKEGRKPSGAGSAQQCHWPWSRAPRSCCLSNAPWAWGAAPSWLHLGISLLTHFLLGRLLAHPLSSLPALSSSPFLCDWTCGPWPLNLDSQRFSGRPEDS